MFLTAELIFTIFLLAAEKHRATFLAPIGIGLSLFIAHLAGVRFTGGECVLAQSTRKLLTVSQPLSIRRVPSHPRSSTGASQSTTGFTRWDRYLALLWLSSSTGE